ncbi:uncharacterized protein EV422DRAFT_507188 [Fimicolochytrium jonesii]|uniref:uncharacterized protein n=1 Tax=Fimicolochytrium jonesii TaxID=1396493 RepID=UPI0022FEC6DE|nr:uncharacterized protein EV422DRAFT_507188 [Fimicolochytrium jonesii]KAI8819530.1 hypothetical protein EV422DRAFT_507188 [Fimicolochytrium jonesii]
MKLTTAAALLSLALGPIGTTASAPADIAITSFSADKNFGHISYKTHFHTPLHHGSQIPLECRGPQDRQPRQFSLRAVKPHRHQMAGPGDRHRAPERERDLLHDQLDWSRACSFPYTGSSAFEGCFDKGVMALTKELEGVLGFEGCKVVHFEG